MISLVAFFIATALLSDIQRGRVFFTKRTWRIGPYIIQREFWCSQCLERGIGPWSFDGGEIEDVPEDIDERILAYAEEFNMRCEELPSYDPDSPPPGATQLLQTQWIPLAKPLQGAFLYDTLQIQIWKAS